MSGAEKIESQVAEWLSRQEREDWSAADQSELDAWLEASLDHEVAYVRLRHGWEKVGRLASLKPADGRYRLQRRAPKVWLAALAAGLVLALGVAANLDRFDLPFRGAAYRTATGGHETVPLADGTKVELSTNTKVRAHVTAQAREVWLDKGEAYFEVTHDKTRPFVVWAGTRKVTVLGTKFSVRREGAEVRVAVLEGRVRVEPVRPAPAAAVQTIVGGDIVVARGASTMVKEASVEKVADQLSWRHGMLTFDQETLAEVAAEFNRYNKVKLVLKDPEVAQTRIGGAFEADNAQAFTELLRSAYGLDVRNDGDKIEIGS